jgi:hypothetical protein
MFKIRLFIIGIYLFMLNFSFSQSLIRGPYLQSLTNKSIKVMWRTTEPTASLVKFGNSVDNLDQTILDTTKVKDHIVLLSGLSAKTLYYYQVGYDETVLAGGNEQHHFYTAPNP